ncbi:MAG: NAD(P)/FAD-dependent oxidoreductase [Bdellovibrionales bacterium]
MERVDTIIVGAGVVGLAVARELASEGREVLVLEAESAIGTITSSRNSGVIHAGIYYKPGSLKARCCVKGRDRLYAYAAEHGIAHKRCGKLIVATADDQNEKLRAWKINAEENGVTDLRMLTPAEARAFEPEVVCTAALHVPVSGIIDVHEYMLALLGDAETKGATLVLRSPVVRSEVRDNGFILETGGVSPMRIACNTLINSAGLGAQEFARNIKGLDPATIPPLVLAKGNYFSLAGAQPFRMLVYPLPVLGSSGLHATCDLAGRVRFGPDVEWIDHIDYRVDPAREPKFEEAIRRYWPALPQGALQPDYSGIRPKLARSSPHDTDFMLQTEREHKVPNLVNLYGIESPGLTASLALAEEVAAALRPRV